MTVNKYYRIFFSSDIRVLGSFICFQQSWTQPLVTVHIIAGSGARTGWVRQQRMRLSSGQWSLARAETGDRGDQPCLAWALAAGSSGCCLLVLEPGRQADTAIAGNYVAFSSDAIQSGLGPMASPILVKSLTKDYWVKEMKNLSCTSE